MNREDLESLSPLAQALVVIGHLYRSGDLSHHRRALLKDLALDGNPFIEGALQLFCEDGDFDELTDSLLSLARVTLEGLGGADEDSDTSSSASSQGGVPVAPSPVGAGAGAGPSEAQGGWEGAAGDSSARLQAELLQFAELSGLGGVSVDDALARIKSSPHGAAGFNRHQFTAALAQFGATADATFTQLAHRLFAAFDGDRNGFVDYSELGAGLSLLCRGSSDSKLDAAFRLFDLDNDGVITVDEMQSYLTSVFTVMFEASPELEADLDVTAAELAEITTASAFDAADTDEDGTISKEEFRVWFNSDDSSGIQSLVGNVGAGGAVAPSPSPSSSPPPQASPSATSERSMSLEQLQALTNLPSLSVADAVAHIRQAGGGGSRLDKGAFKDAFASWVPAYGMGEESRALYDRLVDRLFAAFDTNGDGSVDTTELGAGMALLCSGGVADKVEAAFQLFDLNGDGFIVKEELETFLRSALRVIMIMMPAATDVLGTSDAQAVAKATTAEAFAQADVNKDDCIAFSEFQAWYDGSQGPLAHLLAHFEAVGDE